jgi:hypothetical protein
MIIRLLAGNSVVKHGNMIPLWRAFDLRQPQETPRAALGSQPHVHAEASPNDRRGFCFPEKSKTK